MPPLLTVVLVVLNACVSVKIKVWRAVASKRGVEDWKQAVLQARTPSD
jgi:hypothetical protein